MKHFFALSIALCIALAFIGCSDDDDDDTVVGPSTSNGIAVVSTAGDDEANLSMLDYINGISYNDLLPLSGTSNLAQFGDYIYIVDKDGDRVVKFDPVNRIAVGEMSTGPNSSPMGLPQARPSISRIANSTHATGHHNANPWNL